MLSFTALVLAACTALAVSAATPQQCKQTLDDTAFALACNAYFNLVHCLNNALLENPADPALQQEVKTVLAFAMQFNVWKCDLETFPLYAQLNSDVIVPEEAAAGPVRSKRSLDSIFNINADANSVKASLSTAAATVSAQDSASKASNYATATHLSSIITSTMSAAAVEMSVRVDSFSTTVSAAQSAINAAPSTLTATQSTITAQLSAQISARTSITVVVNTLTNAVSNAVSTGISAGVSERSFLRINRANLYNVVADVSTQASASTWADNSRSAFVNTNQSTAVSTMRKAFSVSVAANSSAIAAAVDSSCTVIANNGSLVIANTTGSTDDKSCSTESAIYYSYSVKGVYICSNGFWNLAGYASESSSC